MKRLRWYDLITVNVFWLGLNIRNNAVGTIIIPYLVDVFVLQELKNTALGAIRASGLIVALVAQPAFGLLSDRNTSRFGRRRPYILAGVVLDLVFLGAMALAWNYWMLFASVLLLQFSANISHAAVQGLIPDLVPEDQRGRASAVKAIFELLPIILVAMTIAKLAGMGRIDAAIAATAGGLLVIMLLTLVLVREEPLKEKPDTPLGPPMLRVLGMLAGLVAGAVAGLAAGAVLGGLAGLITWPLAGAEPAKAVAVGVGGLTAMAVGAVLGVWAGALATLGQNARRHSSFTWWIANRLLFFAAATSIQTFAAFFLMSAFGMTREVAVDNAASLMMVVGVFTLVSALPSGWLSDRIGTKVLVGSAGLIAAAGTAVILSTLAAPSLSILYVGGCIVGLAAGLFTTTNWALGTDLAPRAEAGHYLGVSNLAGAGAGVVGAALGGPMADYINGYQPGLGYFVIFGCYGILFVLSSVSLLGVRSVGGKP
ncbi:MAG TPA: MFS transporter [Anaerolineae bacterium]|nr:MFS transporter [Anaerolineae bacterium]